MKKTLSLLCLSMVIATSFAQLKVDSLGRTAIGYLGTPQSQLSIGNSGNSNYVMSLYNNNKNGLYIDSYNGYTGLYVGMRNSPNPAVSNIGISVQPLSGSTTGSSYGINASSGVSSYSSFGVAGHIFNLAGVPRFGAGIYGSSTYSTTVSHTGVYAGYFNGDVRVTGTIYGNLLVPSTTSVIGDNGSTILALCNTEDESVTNKLQQVQLLQIVNNESKNTNKTLSTQNIDFSSDSINPEALNAFIRENQDIPAIETQMASVRYGLAADQLKEVYPELVYEDADGNVSINYIEMIPLLVQSINELNAKIEELENGNNDDDLVLMSRARGEATGIDDIDETEVLSLAQNKPNPFSESTTIEVTVPENTSTAAIFIYDMSGKQEKQISIVERGKVAISVTSEGLTPGMYLYSLIADGKVVSTKKMILTK